MSGSTPSLAYGSTPCNMELSHLELWQESVNTHTTRVAVISRHQSMNTFPWVTGRSSEVEHLQWTYAELDRGARRLATALDQYSRIDRRPIATLVNTQAEWALLFWAAAYLRSPLVPINPKCATRRDEINHMLGLVNPSVLVVAGHDVAEQLDEVLLPKTLNSIPIKIALGHAAQVPAPWLTLSQLIPSDPTPPSTPDTPHCRDPALILFTSGTTSLPKPCVQESMMCSNAALAYMEARRIGPGHRFVQHLPNFHAYGIAWSLGFWLVGGTVILPSQSFEAQASLETIHQFKATHTSLVPTTAQAMLSHPYFRHIDCSSLVSVDVSGAGVLPSLIDACESALKVPAYTSYGMTESPGTLIWPDGNGSVLSNGHVLSGKPARGTIVKVCDPETGLLVPRGCVGELHNGGVPVIRGYADSAVSSANFYVDEYGTQWVVSGDQAVMERDGSVRISGRYKDMIIRGGENISPASIEDYLIKFDSIDAAQVVGASDEMAGEVPIAIITTSAGRPTDINHLKQCTSRDLGPAFSPKLVLHLKSDLGLDTWPTTASGKIRKVELRTIVGEYLARSNERSTAGQEVSTIDSLIRIWQIISGHVDLHSGTPIQSFADSLMMMQLSSMVKKELARDITVEEFKSCTRIQDQADLIDSQPQCDRSAPSSSRQTPPQVDDMAYLKGHAGKFEATQKVVSNAMVKIGLAWADVEDVVPLPDWDSVFCHRSRPSSWNLRFSYHAPVHATRLEQAIRKSIAYHPTMRSVVCYDENDAALLITVRATARWEQVSISSGWEVESKDDLKKLVLDDPELDNASFPGPLLRLHLAKVRNSNTSGLIVVASHAISDMSMTKLWLEDVIMLLEGRQPRFHARFGDYATAYALHRNGLEADNGVNYWAQKLKNVSSAPQSALWPQQRAPEWFKGCDSGWRRWHGARARAGERMVSADAKRTAQQGVRRTVKIHDLTRLKAEHNVPVFMLVKSAIALMNVAKTNGSEAIFGTINAARTWPFSSDYTTIEREVWAGNPLDISGCTTEYVLDRISVSRSKSVVAFMRAVTMEEEQNSAFAHAPFFRIVDRLRDPLSDDDTRTFSEREGDAEAVLPLIRRQSFNWLPLPPTSQDPRGLQLIEMLTRMDNGLTITGFLAGDKKHVTLSFAWDAEHLSYTEANHALDVLVRLVESMGSAENWDMSVGDVLRL